MEIYFVRHGETEWNRQHMLQGHSDIPLNDAGLAGARKAARALKDISFDRAFASPLARARKTAEIIASEHAGLKVEVNMDLIEMCFGKCEGLNLHKEELPEEEERLRQQLRRWFQDPEHADPVPGGESVKEVKARCRHFLETVIAPLEDHCERILVVAHGGDSPQYGGCDSAGSRPGILGRTDRTELRGYGLYDGKGKTTDPAAIGLGGHGFRILNINELIKGAEYAIHSHGRHSLGNGSGLRHAMG